MSSQESHPAAPPWATEMEHRITAHFDRQFAELKTAITTTVEGMFEAHHKIARLEAARPRPPEPTEHDARANGSDGR